MSAPEDTLESLRAERDSLQGMVDAAAKRGTSTFSVELIPKGVRITGPSDREQAMADVVVGLFRVGWTIEEGRRSLAKQGALESLRAWLVACQGEGQEFGYSAVLDEIDERMMALQAGAVPCPP